MFNNKTDINKYTSRVNLAKEVENHRLRTATSEIRRLLMKS